MSDLASVSWFVPVSETCPIYIISRKTLRHNWGTLGGASSVTAGWHGTCTGSGICWTDDHRSFINAQCTGEEPTVSIHSEPEVLSPPETGRGMNMTILFHLVPRLRKRKVYVRLPYQIRIIYWESEDRNALKPLRKELLPLRRLPQKSQIPNKCLYKRPCRTLFKMRWKNV
jgi:hypothetical protein